MAAWIAAEASTALNRSTLSFVPPPYPQVYCFITAVALVFRTNTAFNRCWEARRHSQPS